MTRTLSRSRAMPLTVPLVAGLTLLGAVLRFAWLDAQPIWHDEQLQVDVASRGSVWEVLLGVVSHSAAAPLDYLGTRLSLVLFNAPRVWPALVGTATTPLLFIVGRRLYSEKVGLVAALLLAVSPFHIYYSGEARYYALSALVVLLPFLGRWFATSVAVGLYTFYFTILVPLGLVIARQRPLFGLLLGVVAFLPWVLLALPSQIAQSYPQASGLAWFPTPVTLGQLVAPDFEVSGLPWIVPALVFLMALALMAWSRAWLLLGISLGAIGVTGLATLAASYFWSPRQVLFVLPLLLLAMAVGWARLPRMAGAAVLVAWVGLQVPFIDGVTGADAWQPRTPNLSVVSIEHDPADDFYTIIVRDGVTREQATVIGCTLMDRELFAVYTESGRILSSWVGC